MGDSATSTTKPSFFACYLLCSLNPRFKGRTYIGFTVNPKRRIRQHNGEITSGARKTQKRRPWEMILCVHGFPSHVHALQFEWAWQHPLKSIAVREAASELKRRGARGQVLLLFTMLNLPEWNSMNLVVNFLSTKHQPLTKGCPSLPVQMHIKVGPLDDLPCYRFPHSELSASADECELEEGDDSGDNSTEESCPSQGIQSGGAKLGNARQGAGESIGQKRDNPHQVLAEIDNRDTLVRRDQDDACKSKQQGESRKCKPKEGDKDAQKISCSKKSLGVVSPSKKRGRPKSSKRKSLSKEGSLVAEAPSLCLEGVDMVAAAPSRSECQELCDEPSASLCLASFASWEAYVDAPCLASPLPWDTQEAYVEPHYASSSPMATIPIRVSYMNSLEGQGFEDRGLSQGPSMEQSLEDLTSSKTPTRSEGANEEMAPYQSKSNVVDSSSVVWDLSPLWSHFDNKEADALSREESSEDTMTCGTPPHGSRRKTVGSGLPASRNEGTVVNTTIVLDASPLPSLFGQEAHASFSEISPSKTTPCWTPPAAPGDGEKSPVPTWNISQFTPLWSPSPFPAKLNGVGSIINEGSVAMNCSFSLSPSPCFPLLRPKAGLSLAVSGGDLNAMEIIDLTDSPAHESYSLKKFTYL